MTDYAEAWERQKAYQARVLAVKMENRLRPDPLPTPNYLIFCEHPPVFTLGKNAKKEHLPSDAAFFSERGIGCYAVERGGDVTFHGPGQIVGYPIFDLENFFTDLSRYMRTLEEAIIRTLSDYGVEAGRLAGYTGVWLEPQTPRARKIAAMGVKCSRWVTMHGFAFNVSTDLRYFDWIVPCGIRDKGVTSLARELGFAPDLAEVKRRLKDRLLELFEPAYKGATPVR
ncbi:MAG: lipoyl(octanoyl) transferase LipB [Bacteroidia bacterium]|nr:lipoyl(octanoyl) transferase LipB [Bacteroidia bacterium]